MKDDGIYTIISLFIVVVLVAVLVGGLVGGLFYLVDLML